MSNFRVVKVSIQGIGNKFVPQYKSKDTFLAERKFRLAQVLLPDRYDVFVSWKNFHTIVSGTDEWKPCFYNTKKEAWNRINKHQTNIELNNKEFEIIAEYYD